MAQYRESLVPWDFQPQEAVPADWPHPAQIVFNPGAGLSNLGTLKSAAQPALTNGALITPFAGELTVKLGTAAVYEHVLFGSAAELSSQAYSGVIRFYRVSTSSLFIFETGGFGGVEIQVTNTAVNLNRSNQAALLSSSNAPVAGWNTLAFSVNGATGRNVLALNGVLSTNTATSTFTSFTAIQTGKWSGNDGNLFYESLFLLSTKECFDNQFLQRVSSNALDVWQLFAPRSIWVPVSSPVLPTRRYRETVAPWELQPQEAIDLSELSGRADVFFERDSRSSRVGIASRSNVTGSPVNGAALYGIGTAFTGTLDAQSTANWPVLADGSEYTYLAVFQLTSLNAPGFIISGDNSFRAFQFRVSSGQVQFIWFNTAVGNGQANGATVAINTPQIAVVTVSAAGGARIFQNGVLSGSNAITGTIKGQSATDIIIGNRASTPLGGSIGQIVRWPYALPDAQAASLSVLSNTWGQLFAPQSTRIPMSTPVVVRQRVREVLVPWDSQPQEVVQASDQWLARGLVYASVPSMHTWDAVGGRLGTLSGTSTQVRAWGLSRGFGTTLGSATSDKLTTTLTAHGVQRTYIARVLTNGTGGSNFGRVFDKLNSAVTTREALFISGANLQFSRLRTTTATDYQWARAGGVAIGASGGVLALRYDSSSTSNAPQMFYDGVLQTPTVTTAGSGTVIDNTDAYVIGNRYDNVRGWDGLIGEFYVFDSLLTDAEIASLSLNPYSVFAPTSIRIPISTGTGRIYYVIGPNAGWVTPTDAEVRAGKLAGGATPTASGSEVSPTVTTAPFTLSADATGLLASTDYRVAYVWSDS